MKTAKIIHWKKNADYPYTGCGIETKPLSKGGVVWNLEKVKTTCKDCIASRRRER